MTTSRLLHERMREKGYSKIRLQNELGCCEKTLRNYLNGTTTSGPYLMKLLAILNISVVNMKGHGRKSYIFDKKYCLAR